jgi:signal transduction histidine kinase
MKGTKIIFIDPEREYKELCEALDGDWINVGGGRGGMLNPLQIRPAPVDEDEESNKLYKDDGNGLGDMVLHIKNLEIFFNLYLPGLADMQKAILKECLIELYNGKGDGSTFLFFAIIITEMNLIFSLKTSIIGTLSGYIASCAICIVAKRNNLSLEYLTDYGISSGASVLFTFIMSYLAKLQINEQHKLKRTNKELQLAYIKLMNNAIEKERLRMAREIHDTLAHTLTAAIVQLEAGKRLVGIDKDRAIAEIDKAQNVTRDGLNEVKRTIKALRPQKMENSNFFEALKIMIDEFEANTGTAIEVIQPSDKLLKLSPTTEVGLFRVIQESLTNSVRHGNAQNILVEILAFENHLNVMIKDDGKGCTTVKKGYGLQGIMERVGEMKGNVQFITSSGKGFETKIDICLEEENQNAD